MDDFDADQPDYQHELYRIVARRIRGEALTIPEVNAYWAQKARNFMLDHPLHTLKRMLIKFHFSSTITGGMTLLSPTTAINICNTAVFPRSRMR